jgi:hypothetical protein
MKEKVGISNTRQNMKIMFSIQHSSLSPFHLICYGPFRRSCWVAVIYAIHCSFSQWLLQPLQDPGLFFSSVIISFTQTVRVFGRVMSPSQGRYLYTGQYKRRINTHKTSMPWVRFEPTTPASEGSWRHRDRYVSITVSYYITYSEAYFDAVLVTPSLLSQRILIGKQVPSRVSNIKAHRLEVTVLRRGRGK